MLQSALGTGEGAFSSWKWLQVAAISEVIVFPQLRLLFLDCQVCFSLGPGVEDKGLGSSFYLATCIEILI